MVKGQKQSVSRKKKKNTRRAKFQLKQQQEMAMFKLKQQQEMAEYEAEFEAALKALCARRAAEREQLLQELNNEFT